MAALTDLQTEVTTTVASITVAITAIQALIARTDDTTALTALTGQLKDAQTALDTAVAAIPPATT